MLVDGFLLFGKSVEASLAPLFNLKILLRTTFASAKEWRGRRKGYITSEGFWQDPPGYFEDVVWPNYVKEHAWLFKDGDVEGEVKVKIEEAKLQEVDDGIAKGERRGSSGVKVRPVAEVVALEETLEWVLQVIKNALFEGAEEEGGSQRRVLKGKASQHR